MIETYPPTLYPASGLTTQDAFVLTGGETPLGSWPAGIVVIPTGMAVAASIRFVGTGADNSEGDCRVYLGEADVARGVVLPTYIGLAELVLGTSTLTLTPNERSTTVSARFADTLTWTPATSATTPKGAGEELLAHFGSDIPTSDYSPADNTSAHLMIGLYGRRFLLLDFDRDTATAMGAVVTLFGAG